jgi:alkylation response protein AidB-like acyl-CoA dehydrogenase
MSEYKAPLDDFQFLLDEVFELPAQWEKNPILNQRIDADTATAMLNECGKLSSELIAPLSRDADEQGCQFDAGKVTTPNGFKQAYNAHAEGGWGGLSGNPDFGALGMPKALAVQCEEMFAAADISFALFPMLTAGACLAIEQHGSEALKQQYLPKMYSGEWAGSMCLTEPHAGSDLGIIRSKAVPNDDGSYAITGTKIFITGGEHDLTENIIHLVLAKLPDAPHGPKGISLFLAPKVLDDGSSNGVSCGSIEHKMGIKASPTCVMNFDSARAYLVGDPNRGLMAMFTMMNYERVGVGIQGIGLSERSYQCAASYARERLQGRTTPATADDNRPQSILAHPDVRRMLLTMRALNEAGRCFASYVANQLDISKFTDQSESKQQAEAQIALLTPVVKAFCTDRGLESCLLGQQVLGGHGYIREWGQEQLVRDVRITQIYEGTNGIQAMDLLNRKVVPDQAKQLDRLAEEVLAFIAKESDKLLPGMAEQLSSATASMQRVSHSLIDQQSKALNGSTAVYYQDLFGYWMYGYMWARMTAAAQSDNLLHRNKRIVAEFYFSNLLPRMHSLEQIIANHHSSVMAMDASDF